MLKYACIAIVLGATTVEMAFLRQKRSWQHVAAKVVVVVGIMVVGVIAFIEGDYLLVFMCVSAATLMVLDA